MTPRDQKCDLCGELVTPITCYYCGQHTCEECGRIDVRYAGSIRCREVWQCGDCEFSW